MDIRAPVGLFNVSVMGLKVNDFPYSYTPLQ